MLLKTILKTFILLKFKMMLLDNKFNIGDTVFLKTDTQQNERLVTGINIRQSGITFALSYGSNESWHYDFEISLEKDVIKQITD